MANAMMEVPREATKAAVWAATSGGRAALHAGEGMFHRIQPGYIPPEVVAQQAVLKRFEGRFGVVDLLDEGLSEDQLAVRAYTAADDLVEEGVVDEHSVVELRPVVPAITLRDRAVNERRERAVELLQLAFEEEHNVMAVPLAHPITPTERPDSVDATQAWDALVPEMDGLWRQVYRHRHPPSLVGITGFSYDRKLFSGHIAVTGNPAARGFLVLDHVGERPQDNYLTLHASAAA